MIYKIVLWTTTVLLIFFSQNGIGQELSDHSTPEVRDVVYLRNGSEFRGKLLKYSEKEGVHIRSASGEVFVFHIRSVKLGRILV
jgi:hypothetical protein